MDESLKGKLTGSQDLKI